MSKINVLSREVTVLVVRDEDYICLTDIARYKDQDGTDDLIRNWLRNRNTLEFLGIWEQLNNPGFKPVEFDGFKKLAGLNSFTLTPKQWIEKTAAQWRAQNPDKTGNIRDYADVSQLVCLSDLENLNALFITEALPQSVRLQRLNQIAIHQMHLLTTDMHMKRLPPKK